MPVSTADPIRVTVLADSDTRWEWGVLTARRTAADVAMANSASEPARTAYRQGVQRGAPVICRGGRP